MNLAAFTSDRLIRTALIQDLQRIHESDPEAKIVQELGITHGAARIDIAVIDGSIHGYELKSDMDTLRRLPGQMGIYNSVLDEMTLVVGKSHLRDAINLVPEWWGIVMAKVAESTGAIVLHTIREAEENPQRDSAAIASLLWRDEALHLLEEVGAAEGMKSKTRRVLYEKLASVLDQDTLRLRVRKCLFSRVGWRSAQPHMQYDG